MKKIKGVLLDVDGVLTDAKKYYFQSKNDRGYSIAKSFSVRDGKGIDLAQKKDIVFGIITADKWPEILDRAKDMNVHDVYYDCHDKILAADQFCKKYNLDISSEVCFIGDDVNDLPLLEKVALPVAVADAVAEVIDLCLGRDGYITYDKGGEGAVRDAISYILENNND
jgi:3-deoxy-D-manno-octulosonate 8-phosphate phosphatase (KDO 8-P phosphatase)